MDKNASAFDGACHCGGVRFSVELSDGLNSARRCTCSYCRMRGAIAVSAKLADFHLLAGEDILSTYSFNTHEAQHHFCSRCGIYTHHQRRSRPDEYGINAACLTGLSPFDFEEVPVLDGQNHPRDNGGRAQLAGVLRFIRKD